MIRVTGTKGDQTATGLWADFESANRYENKLFDQGYEDLTFTFYDLGTVDPTVKAVVKRLLDHPDDMVIAGSVRFKGTTIEYDYYTPTISGASTTTINVLDANSLLVDGIKISFQEWLDSENSMS